MTIKSIKTLTLAEFAALPPIWPECFTPHGSAILIARIHPNCNRPSGDDDVAARALALDKGELRRLTIRWGNITPRHFAAEDPISSADVAYSAEYQSALLAVAALPVLDLTAGPHTGAKVTDR